MICAHAWQTTAQTIALSTCLSGLAVGQSISQLEARRAAAEEIQKRENEDRRRAEENRRRLEAGEQGRAPAGSTPMMLWLESQLPGKEKKLLAAHPDEQQKYATFLQQPDTGLCKLIAVESQVNRTVSLNQLQHQKVVIPIRGGGAFYSFAKRRHDADEWAQIRLLDGRLQSGLTLQTRFVPLPDQPASVSQFTPEGLNAFVVLGNIPLEEITLETQGVKFLREMIPPAIPEELKILTGQLNAGLVSDTYVYRSALLAVPEMTCILRSVIYKQADQLLALRIVRQDTDGSLHILWKQLKKFPAPAFSVKSDNKAK